MPRYKPSDCHSLMLPVVLSEQIVPGSFAFALDYDHELDLTALDARFKNDFTGACAFDPRVLQPSSRATSRERLRILGYWTASFCVMSHHWLPPVVFVDTLTGCESPTTLSSAI